MELDGPSCPTDVDERSALVAEDNSERIWESSASACSSRVRCLGGEDEVEVETGLSTSSGAFGGGFEEVV